ncbi:MAG: hypothetical protein U0401_19440 [Anaerolineae bacterium]
MLQFGATNPGQVWLRAEFGQNTFHIQRVSHHRQLSILLGHHAGAIPVNFDAVAVRAGRGLADAVVANFCTGVRVPASRQRLATAGRVRVSKWQRIQTWSRRDLLQGAGRFGQQQQIGPSAPKYALL